jgi:hypothetical protein
LSPQHSKPCEIFGISGEPDHTFAQMAVPVLPLDVIHLIACYLVGMCAFASIAALRLVDRAVEETVLPVLYETISAEDIKILSSSTDSRDKRRLEAMRRYTK